MKTHHWGATFALLACATLGLNAHAAETKPDAAHAPAETATPAANAPANGAAVGKQGQQPAGAGIGGSSGSTGGHDEAPPAENAGATTPSAQSDRAKGTGPGGDAGISAHEAQAITDGAIATPDAPAGAVQENSVEKEKREQDREKAKSP